MKLIYPVVNLESIDFYLKNKKKYSRKPMTDFSVLAKEEPLFPKDDGNIKEDYEDVLPDPYALFSAVAEDVFTLKYPQYQDDAQIQCHGEVQGDAKSPCSCRCSCRKIVTDESAPEKKKVKKLKKRPVQKSISCSGSDSESEIKELKKRILMAKTKVKLRNRAIRKWKQKNFNTEGEVLKWETKYTLMKAQHFNLKRELETLKEKMKKMENDNEELKVKLDAQKASLAQHYDNIEDLKLKDIANQSVRMNYLELQKKQRRAIKKIDNLDVKNKRLMKRITYSRKINKQSMHWLTELKEASGKSLGHKRLRTVNSLIEEIKKSLELQIEE